MIYSVFVVNEQNSDLRSEEKQVSQSTYTTNAWTTNFHFHDKKKSIELTLPPKKKKKKKKTKTHKTQKVKNFRSIQPKQRK